MRLAAAHFSEQNVAKATALTMAGSEQDGAATLLHASVFGHVDRPHCCLNQAAPFLL
jgi:hypothetical protein